VENKIFLPPRSWLDSIADIGSEVDYRGYTDAVLYIDGYYYNVIFYTKEGLKWELDNIGIFGQAGVIALDTINMVSITNALNAIISSSYFFKHLHPYESLHTNMHTLIDRYISIPLKLETFTEFSNLRNI
jgi:hypothetical protein